MNLNGRQQKQLVEILTDAFPKRIDLAQMVRFGLDENLDKLTPDTGTLAGTVFQLVEWARAHGRVEDLLKAAIAANPEYPPLIAFVNQLEREVAAPHFAPMRPKSLEEGVRQPVHPVQEQPNSRTPVPNERELPQKEMLTNQTANPPSPSNLRLIGLLVGLLFGILILLGSTIDIINNSINVNTLVTALISVSAGIFCLVLVWRDIKYYTVRIQRIVIQIFVIIGLIFVGLGVSIVWNPDSRDDPILTRLLAAGIGVIFLVASWNRSRELPQE